MVFTAPSVPVRVMVGPVLTTARPSTPVDWVKVQVLSPSTLVQTPEELVKPVTAKVPP